MNLHNDFMLHSQSISKEELIFSANVWIKEGLEYQKHIGQFIIDWFSDSKTISVKTSGSTGKPKSIMLKKSSMIASAEATLKYFQLFPKNAILLCLSAEFIAGKMMLVRAFVGGLNLFITEPSQNPLKDINYYFDFVAMVPMQVEASLEEIHKVTHLIIGGAAVSFELKSKLLKQKTYCYETYGMTETITHVAVRKIGEKFYEALPKIKIKTDDRSCLAILVPYISNDYIQTNDIAEIKSNNSFDLKGRIDDVINSGGFKLFPNLIEEKLSAYIKKPFFISKLPDEKLGEKVVLVIEGDFYKIDSKIFDQLHKYEKPKEIIFKTKFELTGSGKILRKI